MYSNILLNIAPIPKMLFKIISDSLSGKWISILLIYKQNTTNLLAAMKIFSRVVQRSISMVTTFVGTNMWEEA
jgi:hypothetical protein